MNVIDEVRREREDLARVMKKHTGIRKIVEDLYPDSAHFIYELLQNAEDAGATEALFTLSSKNLIFEHNGRPFNKGDILAITDIGEGTKAGDDDKIGRFGIGFKAVFAYSETPHIWSPTLSFKITDLVLPTILAPAGDLRGRTRFNFPFNNLKKKEKDAFSEVEKGLDDLSETTLLFLSNLVSIGWKVEKGLTGKIVRIGHSKNHIEIQKQRGGKTTGYSHFLKFERAVEGTEKQRVVVAFELEFLPKVQLFEPKRPLAKQMKIMPTNPGKVAVFFAAEKEASGLRFHLHAPFVPELSRASIKETQANRPLFEQLALLAGSSLYQIRDLGLLTADFLEVLPNDRDEIPERYQGIRSAIIEMMNKQPLTPTHSRTHAPAYNLLQGKASLKNLLSDDDLAFLVDYDDEPPQWAVGATQKNSNGDRFLESLAVRKWDIDDFVKLLCNKTASSYKSGPPRNISSGQVMEWLGKKSVEWHQDFYALLLTEHLLADNIRREQSVARLKSLRVVRLTDGTYGIGCDSYFVSDEVIHDEVLPRVDPAVYTTGKSKVEKDNARAFLEKIGVRTVGEAELVEAILKKRYTYHAEIPDEKTHQRDIKQFVKLVDSEPDKAALFEEYYIFKSGEFWLRPREVFLDQPFLDTGLNAYYLAIDKEPDRSPLCNSYQECGIGLAKIAKFALAVGATKSLAIQETTCRSNPHAQYLVREAEGTWSKRHSIDTDYHIPRLGELMESTNAGLSRLIWSTLCEQIDVSWTVATYRNNSPYVPREAPSQLVCILKDRAWLPQVDGRFVRPAEASRDLLPVGFAFDPGYKWLPRIQFGQQLAKKSEEDLQLKALAMQLGCADEAALDRVKRFAAMPTDDQRRILADHERRARHELPDQEPANPLRRAERLQDQASDAPERRTEERIRSVSVGREAVKQEAQQYLRQQYTNGDGLMICQVCKERLPFTLDDGNDYFERVEFLRNFKRLHALNFLALCPNHAAMFQHANGSTAELPDLVGAVISNEMPIILARESMTIYFTKTHVADLKAIIAAEQSERETADIATSESSNRNGVPVSEVCT